MDELSSRGNNQNNCQIFVILTSQAHSACVCFGYHLCRWTFPTSWSRGNSWPSWCWTMILPEQGLYTAHCHSWLASTSVLNCFRITELVHFFQFPLVFLNLRWLQATKSIISGTNTQALTAKADLLKEEMDESMNKVELCKVNIINKDDWCPCMETITSPWSCLSRSELGIPPVLYCQGYIATMSWKNLRKCAWWHYMQMRSFS